MEILRARGTEFRGVNQEYLCVRGRFGYEFVNSAGAPDRAARAAWAARSQPASFDEAVAFAAARLREIAAQHGPGSIAFLGGEKLNLEEQYLFQKLARARARHAPRGRAHALHRAASPGDAMLRATGGGRPLTDVRRARRAREEVLVLGDDLQGEAPFAQAAADPRPAPARAPRHGRRIRAA